MNLLFVFAISAVVSSSVHAVESQAPSRCALMLGSEAPGSHNTFLIRDEERVMGLFLPPPDHAHEGFSVVVNHQDFLNLDSARQLTPWLAAVYRWRRKRIRVIGQEIQSYFLVPSERMTTPVVVWSERDDEEGIAPQVAVALHARALFRPVIRDALRRWIHQASTYQIPDAVIDEAFAKVEAHAASVVPGL